MVPTDTFSWRPPARTTAKTTDLPFVQKDLDVARAKKLSRQRGFSLHCLCAGVKPI
jgi:hypothetical protein